MLEIRVPGQEYFDAKSNEFRSVKGCTLRLEHSLVSVSKWEAKWCKVFLSETPKTEEENFDYVRCMCLDEPEDPSVFYCLTKENIAAVNEYISSPMSATFFREEKASKKSREPVTSELMYYWLVTLQIPFEVQYWHLNRLLTLVRICNMKNRPPKKSSTRDIMSRNAALNAARRKASGSKG